jgi:hypothetical protein
MRATTPLQIKGNNAIVTREMTPSQQQQGRLCINNSDNAIIIRAKIAITTMAKTLHMNGNNTIATWVMAPARQQVARVTTLAQQWRRHACASTTASHHDKSNICHRNTGKDACALTVAMPACQ